MSVEWAEVPPRHRGRDYEWTRDLVRVSCRCGWRGTLAEDLERAYRLWVAHVRQARREPGP